MEKLLSGYEWFRSRVYPYREQSFLKLAHRQAPQALLITCADSRIDPAMLLQCEPGDLFLCRNAGNIVPPHSSADGAGGCGVAATVEYAIEVLKIPEIVILGHSDCGAMKGVLHPESLTDKPAVAKWLKHAECARAVAGEHEATHDILRAVAEQNIKAQVGHLASHPAVSAALDRGALGLHGWYYDMPAGQLHEFDSKTERFEPLNWTAVNQSAWLRTIRSAA